MAHPTDPVPVMETRNGDLAPQAWICAVEVRTIDDDVTASVTPRSLQLELRTGYCDTAGNLQGSSSTGTFASRVPHGVYHLMVGNPTDAMIRYSLVVQYLTPSI